MKRLSVLLPLALGVSLGVACGKAEEKGAGIVEAASKKYSEASEELSKLTPEAAKQKVTTLVNEAVAAVSSVKDAASAERVKNELEPLLDKLSQLKTAVAAKLDLGALEKALQDAITKGDAAVRSALTPLLDKVRGLMA
jgi:hypothetical protein